MVDVRPFRALRAEPARAHDLVSPPYDVMNAAEARAMVADGRNRFLHVSRPEIDLPPDADPASDAVYTQARMALAALIDDGSLVRESTPVMYVLRQTMGTYVQVGIVASASVDDYDATRIRIHEYTRPDKERDRVRHVDAVDAHDEPVFLTYPADETLAMHIHEVMAGDALIDVVAEDGVWHELWRIDGDERIVAITQAFAAIPRVYVADGHHRSAAASAVRRLRRGSEGAAGTDAEGRAFADGLDGFLAVFVPTDRVHVMAYHRVVKDLGDLTPEAFLDALRTIADVQPSAEAVATHDQDEFGVRMPHGWYRCRYLDPPTGGADPLTRLDVSLLQERVLRPILGIDDPRTDSRLHFVGGIRGTHELDRLVDEGAACAFSLAPTSIHELIDVADRGEVMPPKSTWFEPKLPSGLVLHPIS
jgi:uncharacterized protein (DUF1015 family)